MYKLEELYSVKGKVVLVTGGGTGIGKAIVGGFVENGAKVYITGRRAQVLAEAEKELGPLGNESGGSVHSITGDVGTKAGCVAIAEALTAKEGHLDVLINCAGVGSSFRKAAHPNDADAVEAQLRAVEDEDLSFTNAVNVNGVFFLTAALLPLLRKSSDPSVVNIASIAGLANQRATGSLMYGTSKAGTIHLGKLLAGRLSPMKIRVNTICPGIFPSEMTGEKDGQGMDSVAVKAALRSPLGRAGQAHEIVAPVLMLSSKGGGYINGAVLTVDGGRLLAAGINDGIRLPDETETYL